MSVWMLVVGLQAAAAGPPAFDLKMFHAAGQCPVQQPDEDIVVCGRNEEPYRLKPMPEKEVAPMLPKAEIGIGKSKLSAETESAGVGGFTSKRAMVRLKIPF